MTDEIGLLILAGCIVLAYYWNRYRSRKGKGKIR